MSVSGACPSVICAPRWYIAGCRLIPRSESDYNNIGLDHFGTMGEKSERGAVELSSHPDNDGKLTPTPNITVIPRNPWTIFSSPKT